MSALQLALAEYVATRRALGSKFHEPAQALQHFVNFLENQGAEFVTWNLALRWAKEPAGAQPATWARRLCAVRGFAGWLNATDARNEIPPKALLGTRHRRPTPYIYTDQEIEALMAAAGNLRSKTGLRALTHSTIIGLLASTGMRPGEALALDDRDTDLRDGILAVRDTKFGKSRFVPIEDSTRNALSRYVRHRNRVLPHRWTDSFLVGESGRRLAPSVARRSFAKQSVMIGIRAPAPAPRIGRGPRLHDLRHTFATKKLIEWYRAGLDVTRLIPRLSTYLGHVSVKETYWYIQAVPELLQCATRPLVTRGAEGEQ
jgi:integrase